MDYKRLTLAALAAWVIDSAYGFVVWGNLLKADFERYPAVFRSEAEITGMMPLMFAGILVGLFGLAWIYAKGYEGGSGLAEGLRFGVALGVVMTGMMSIGMYATTNIGGALALKASIATFIEMIVIGTTMGAVYRPAVSPKRTPAAL